MSNKFPIYKKSKSSSLIVKFIAPTSGYVVDPGTTSHSPGTYITTWVSYSNSAIWESYEYLEKDTNSYSAIQELNIFESYTIPISRLKDAAITKVPNGYVMPSHSGHQLFIKENTKETL